MICLVLSHNVHVSRTAVFAIDGLEPHTDKVSLNSRNVQNCHLNYLKVIANLHQIP